MADPLDFLRSDNAPRFEPYRGPLAAPSSVRASDDRPGVVGGGLRAGFNELQGLGGAAVSAVGKLTGAQGLEQWGATTAAKNFGEAQQFGRPDLEVAPWREGGASVLPWLGYQISKQVPTLVGTLAATAATGGVGALAAPAAAGAGRAAAAQALRAGATRSAAQSAARRAVVGSAVRRTSGGLAFGSGIGLGSMYNEALERGDPTRADALKAVALAPLYGATELVPDLLLGKVLAQGAKTVGRSATRAGITAAAQRVATGTALGAATEAPTEALQTVLENSFRPDLSQEEKSRRIVDAALTGAAVGGSLRGAASIRPLREKSPQDITDDEISQSVDGSLQPAAQTAPAEVTGEQLVEQALAREAQPDVQPVVGPQQAEQPEMFSRPEMPEAPRPFADYTPEQLEFTAQATLERQGQPDVPQQEREQAQQILGLIRDEVALRQEEQAAQTPEVPVTEVGEGPTLFEPEQVPQGTPAQIAEQRAVQEAQIAEEQAAREAPEIAAREEARLIEDAALGIANRGTVNQRQTGLAVNDQGQATVSPRADTRITKAAAERDRVRRQYRDLETLNPQQQARLERVESSVRDLNAERTVLQARADQVNNLLGQGEETINAIQEQRAAQVDVRQPAEVSAEIPSEDAGRRQVTPEEILDQAEIPRVVYRGGGQATFSDQPPADTEISVRGGEAGTSIPYGDLTNLSAVTKAVRAVGLGPAEARANAQAIVNAVKENGVEAISDFNTPALNMRISDPNFRAEAVPSIEQVVKVDRSFLTPDRQDVRQPSVQQDLANEGFRFAQVTTPQGDRFVELPQPTGAFRITGEQPAPTPERTQQAQARLAQTPVDRPQYTIPPASKVTPAEVKQPVPFNQPGPGVTDIPAAPSFKADGTQKTMADVRAEAAENPSSVYNAMETDPGTKVDVPNSPQKDADALKTVGEKIEEGVRRLGRTSLERLHPTLQDFVLYAQDKRSIIRQAKGLFPSGGLEQLQEAGDVRANLENHIARVFNATVEAYKALKPETQDLIGKTMQYNIADINYQLSWDQHTWLQDDPNAADLRKVVNEANADYRRLKQKEGGRGARVLNSFADANRTIALGYQASALHQMILRDAAVGDVAAAKRRIGEDPIFELVSRKRLADPRKMVPYLEKRRDELLQKAEQVSARRRADSATNNTPLTSVTSELEQFIQELKPRLATEGNVQYFHAGRVGDHRLGFRIRTTETADGRRVIDPVARDAVAKAYADADITAPVFGGPAEPSVGASPTTNNTFMKFETQREQVKAEQVARRLMADGVLESDSEIAVGFDMDGAFSPEEASRWSAGLTDYIKANMLPTAEEASTMSATQLEAVRRDVNLHTGQVHRYFLNSLPVSAAVKLEQRRRAVDGYQRDMFRSYAHRALAGARGMASSGTAYQRMEANNAMAADIRDLGTISTAAGDVASPRANAAQKVKNEFVKREAQRAAREEMPLLGKVRAVNHVFYLGLSPAYMLLTTLQVPIVALPKIGAVYGYAKTVNQLSTAVPLAGRVVRAMVKNTNFGEAGFATLNEQSLRNEGVTDPADIQMIMDLMDTMAIDIGAQIRELGSVASNQLENGFDKTLRVAGAAGFYSEVAARLTTGVATHRMARERGMTGQALIREVRDKIHTTMFDFTQENVGRATGTEGILGRATPLAAAFQQYNYQLLSMLYTETTNALRLSDATPAEVTQARKFLAWHAGMVTALAGSMGLPFAAVISRIAEEGMNALRGDEEEPINMDLLYRNMLADTFGADVGEVLARGLPRAFGFDLSTRVGEQHVLPFSKFIEDRRAIKDAFPDMAARAFGAPVGILVGGGTAAERMADGDLLGAMKESLPIALRNVVKALDMADGDYTNTSGRTLPISPTGLDIMYQGLGLSPQQRSEYNEFNNYERILTGKAQQRKQLITRQITAAVRTGDRELLGEWLDRAGDWDQNNPGNRIMPTLTRTVKSRLRGEAEADVLNVPLNARTSDPALYERLRGANF